MEYEIILLAGFLGKIFKGDFEGLFEDFIGLADSGISKGIGGTAEEFVRGKLSSGVGLLENIKGAYSGNQHRNFLEKAYPGTTPWEQLGGPGGASSGQAPARIKAKVDREGFGVQKEINNAMLRNQMKIARLKADTDIEKELIKEGYHLKGAEMTSGATRYAADQSYEGTKLTSAAMKEAAKIHAKATERAALGRQDPARSALSTLWKVYDEVRTMTPGEIVGWLEKNPGIATILGAYFGSKAIGAGASGIISILSGHAGFKKLLDAVKSFSGKSKRKTGNIILKHDK